MAKVLQPKCLEGKYCNLREVTLDDAEFILSLRCDPKKSKYLNPTENNVEKQKEYLKKYLTLDNEWYFIIENKENQPVGTTRIYDIKGKQYTGGSWLMVDGIDLEILIESSFLSRNYAFNVLHCEKDFFDVRKGNKKVVNYHLNYGAKIIDENEIDYFFEYFGSQFNETKSKTMDLLGYNAEERRKYE